MKKNLLKVAGPILIILAILTGCQNQPEVPAPKDANQAGDQMEFTLPASKGPTGPPAMQGPADGPPDNDSAALKEPTDPKTVQPQAVTEKENIRLTLPLQNS